MKRAKKMAWMALLVFSVGVYGMSYSQYIKQNEVVETATYSWGSRGNTVRTIQTKLRNWGYFDGAVDGIYGQQTFTAVQNFQRANNLNPDGIAGNQTPAAMGIFEGVNPSGPGTSPSTPLTPEGIDENVYLLASAIHGEARGEPYEGQVAVGAVILNRVDSPQFPNSIPGVVYQRGAFDAVVDGQINLVPNETSIQAAIDALNGWDPTNGALYYWNPATATSRWIWSVPITTRIGRHVFGTK